MTLVVASPARRVGFARGSLLFGGLVALLAIALLIGVGAGRFAVAPGRVLAILASGLADPLAMPETVEARIVLLVRLPRLLLAALVGAGLATAGAALQGVFRNPLVAPQVLGISQGAAFGGALAIVFGIWGAPLLGMAFLAGLGALAIVGAVARIDGRTEIVTVILSGMIVGALFAALVSLLQFVADPNTSLPAIVYWLMGSFSSATWARLGLAAPALILGLVALWALRFRLNLLSLDEAEARSLGVRVGAERWAVFTVVALIVGAQVAVSGIVGWIGLVVPHAARLIAGEDHRVLIPAAALLGAAYLVIVDTIARTLTSAEIPLGVLTALIGAPVFALLLRRHFRERVQ